jgi:phosphatidylinositol dimannoside acyltransferase
VSAVADQARLTAYRTGWRVVRLMPEGAAYRLFDVLAARVHRRGGRQVDRLRSNYAVVRPELGDAALEDLVREGLRSYLRYWCDAFRLADRSPDELALMVRCVGDAPVRAAVAAGQGQVFFLGHLGNWDTAGAWATCHLSPVTTVAERLRPEELYAEFLAFRRRLGMTILPLTGERGVFERLQDAVRGGAIVPLLADRDLSSTGVEVDLCGRRAAVAAGPAALALSTGAPLRPVTVHYELRPDRPAGPAAYRIVVTFGEEAADPGTGTRAERIRAMTQQCVDALAVTMTEHTADWHMMQRVFVGAREPVT